MDWLYSILIGLVLGLIIRSKRESIALNIFAGIVGALIGAVFFKYLIKAPFSNYIDMLKWGRYAFFVASFFGALMVIMLKRAFASGFGS